jgi:hypothetical protein
VGFSRRPRSFCERSGEARAAAGPRTARGQPREPPAAQQYRRARAAGGRPAAPAAIARAGRQPPPRPQQGAAHSGSARASDERRATQPCCSMPAEDAPPPAEPRSPQAAVVAQTEITTWAGSVHRLKAWVWGVEEKAEHIEEKLQGGVRRISHALSSSPIKVGRSTLSSMAASAKNYYTSSHHFLRLCRSTFAAMDMGACKGGGGRRGGGGGGGGAAWHDA